MAGKDDITGYIDSQGIVTQLPTKRRKKIRVLCYLASQIPADRVFTEREFNGLLCSLHSFHDPATLRRELYDYFLINRESDGKRYWLNLERPGEEELLEKYCK